MRMDVIRKQRAAVTKGGVRRLLEGDYIDPSCLFRADHESVNAMDNFGHLSRQIGAVPSVFVVYFREAYVAPVQQRFAFDVRPADRVEVV